MFFMEICSVLFNKEKIRKDVRREACIPLRKAALARREHEAIIWPRNETLKET